MRHGYWWDSQKHTHLYVSSSVTSYLRLANCQWAWNCLVDTHAHTHEHSHLKTHNQYLWALSATAMKMFDWERAEGRLRRRERERPNEGTNKRIVWLLLKLAIFNSVAGISNNLSREESLPEVYLHISSSPYLYCYDFISGLFQAAQRAAGVCFCY